MNTRDFKIIAAPDTLIDYSQSVTLNVHGPDLSSGLSFEWKCRKYYYLNLKCDC